MKVRDAMDPQVVECTEDMPLVQVFRLLKNGGRGHVVVLEGRNHRIPLGIVTEREICEQLVEHERKPRSLAAANVMTSKVYKVSEAEDLSKVDLAGHDVALVVDEAGGLSGALTREGIQSAKRREDASRRTGLATRDVLPAARWLH